MGLIGNEPKQKVEILSICGQYWHGNKCSWLQLNVRICEMSSLWIWKDAEEDHCIRKPRKVEEAFLRTSGGFIVDRDGRS